MQHSLIIDSTPSRDYLRCNPQKMDELYTSNNCLYVHALVFPPYPGLSSNSLKNHFFENGWTILNRKKDISDDEWETWTEFLFKLIPWMLIHLSTSELLRSTYIEVWVF